MTLVGFVDEVGCGLDVVNGRRGSRPDRGFDGLSAPAQREVERVRVA
jgi:hypothetical protein